MGRQADVVRKAVALMVLGLEPLRAREGRTKACSGEGWGRKAPKLRADSKSHLRGW